jgi:glutamyl/glutaminyl-tRNA synthetase
LQSQRLDSYRKYAQVLIDKGYAYPDPYSEEEVAAFRAKLKVKRRLFLYRDHRPEIHGSLGWDKAHLRFKVPNIKSYTWTDAVRGELTAGPEALDDFILIKSDGYPTYNFAHIIDDLEMGVTHIMRADEFIASTPKFLSLYEALDIVPPVFVTLPPILAPEGNKKLGKRDGAKDILEYRNEGYLPQAMVNFLAFLGWNPGGEKEIMTPSEIIEEFSIERIHKGGAMLMTRNCCG